MKARKGYWHSESGAGAAEFVLVLIPFLALIMGIIEVSLMFYANHTLQYAAEAAARCYSVSSATTCNSTTAVQNYATSHYGGPRISPTFSVGAPPGTPDCGHTVTGAANFPLHAVVYTFTVPLSATACFP